MNVNDKKISMKISALLLSFIIFSFMLNGCQKTNEPSPFIQNTKKREVVELVWWNWGDAPKNCDDIIKALNEKSLQDIQTKVIFKWATSNDEKMKAVIKSGESYDIAFVSNWYADYYQAALSGQLLDITEKLQKAAPTLSNYLPKAMWDGVRVKGKIYGIPTYKDTAIDQYWICNKDYITKADALKEFEATTKEVSSVTPLLRKLKKYYETSKEEYPSSLSAPFNMNKAGLIGHDTGWEMLIPSMRLGIKLSDEECKIKVLYEDEEYKNDLKTIRLWQEEGLVNADAATLNESLDSLCVSSEKTFLGAETELSQKYDCKVLMNRRYGPVFTTNEVQGAINAIGVNSLNADRALEYLEYINLNSEYRNMLAYGIEDKNYKKDINGSVIRLNDQWKPAEFSQATFFTMLPLSPNPSDMWTNLKPVFDQAEVSQTIGFVPQTEQLYSKIANCTTIVERYYVGLQCGSYPDVDETIKTVMIKLNECGLGQIKRELTKQLEEFYKK